jgi:hypothetical protein
MDLYKVIQDLYVEEETLKRIIVSIEDMHRLAGGKIPPKGEKRRTMRKKIHERNTAV